MTNDHHEYKSSVLNCFIGDDHCDTCRFIAGDRSPETMLAVIRNLDEMLAKEEKMCERLIEIMNNAIAK